MVAVRDQFLKEMKSGLYSSRLSECGGNCRFYRLCHGGSCSGCWVVVLETIEDYVCGRKFLDEGVEWLVGDILSLWDEEKKNRDCSWHDGVVLYELYNGLMVMNRSAHVNETYGSGSVIRSVDFQTFNDGVYGGLFRFYAGKSCYHH